MIAEVPLWLNGLAYDGRTWWLSVEEFRAMLERTTTPTGLARQSAEARGEITLLDPSDSGLRGLRRRVTIRRFAWG